MAYHEIDNRGSLYFLLNSFIGAYNRRTDVMERNSEAAFQARVDALTQDLKTSTDKVEEAINADKGETNGT